jgi:hypothetical protein
VSQKIHRVKKTDAGEPVSRLRGPGPCSELALAKTPPPPPPQAPPPAAMSPAWSSAAVAHREREDPPEALLDPAKLHYT